VDAKGQVTLGDGRHQISATRIACLGELLAYNRLGGLLPTSLMPSEPESDWGPDPNLGQFRTAVALVRDAGSLRSTGKLKAAVDRCNEALTLAPKYARARLERSQAYLAHAWVKWSRLPREDRQRYIEWAFQDSYWGLRESGGENEAWLMHAQSAVYRAYPSRDTAEASRTIVTLSGMLENWRGSPLTEDERGFAYCLRAECRVLLGELDRASQDYDLSIHASPLEPRNYLDRATFKERLGQLHAADADRAKAQALEDERRIPGPPVPE
jgi:hypothetical protein